MPLAPVLQDDAADDHYQNSGRNDQAGKDKEFEFGNSIPRRGTERLVDVDEDQCKKGGPQNQPNDVPSFMYIGRNIPI